MLPLFISYRRSDSPDTVKLIHERLKQRLPRWELFYDHESIPLGEQFPELLRAKVVSAAVVLVIIGPKWLEILHERKDATIDHTRAEVRLALETTKRVVPILVGHAAMPTAADLADFVDLQPLLQRNGHSARPDPDFDGDIESIILHLKKFESDEDIGATLADKYTLTAEIAHGGMGVVYLAEQKRPVKRTVAVKLIKPGMDSKDVLARFDAERQALAVMDHPNIAKVLDAGITPSSRPFFVMEYVKGVHITQYCDEKKLSPQERLSLFIPVCNAVQHAHQKGIIHRDLKPSNVLVEVVDGNPVPKVIDFGLAKALGQKLTEKTLYTVMDTRIGTLEYSAPEQAAGRYFDVDTRSDIYSLGVLLYELLTGAPPFTHEELLKIGDEEMRRVIREDEPIKPSKKLSSSGKLPAIAANRHLEPDKLRRLVQGDLDWIVMKCLEKENAHRYETANQLGQELQRFLADEPVLASPPSAAYRLRKFVRRNKAGLLAAAAVVLALVVGTVMSSYFAMVAGEKAVLAQNKEREAAEKAEQLTKALANVEETLATGLLRPLGHREDEPLNEFEVSTLEEVARIPMERNRVRLLFIDRTFEDPVSVGQLGRRLEQAVHAAVGLDRARRTAVLEIVKKRLQDPNTPLASRLLAARIAAELLAEDAELVKKACDVLLKVLNDKMPGLASMEVERAFKALAGSLDKQGCRLLIQRALDYAVKTKDAETLKAVAERIKSLTNRADSLVTRQAATALVKQAGLISTTTIELAALEDLAKCCELFTDQADPRLTRQAAANLTGQLLQCDKFDRDSYSDPSKIISKLITQLDNESATSLVKQAVELSRKTSDNNHILSISKCICVLVEKADPAVSREALITFTLKLGRGPSDTIRELAAKLDKNGATLLLKELLKTSDDANLESLAHCIDALAVAAESTISSQATATVLKRTLERANQTTDHYDWRSFANIVSLLKAHAEQGTIREASTALVERALELSFAIIKWLKEPHDSSSYATRLRYQHLNALTEFIAKFADETDPMVARHGTTTLFEQVFDIAKNDRMNDSDEGNRSLIRIIKAVAGKVDPEAAQSLVKQVLKLYADSFSKKFFAEALSLFASKLDRQAASALAGQVLDCMSDINNGGIPDDLAVAIEAMADKLDRETATALVRRALTLAAKPTDVKPEYGKSYKWGTPSVLGGLARVIKALAGKADPMVTGQAATALIKRCLEVATEFNGIKRRRDDFFDLDLTESANGIRALVDTLPEKPNASLAR